MGAMTIRILPVSQTVFNFDAPPDTDRSPSRAAYERIKGRTGEWYLPIYEAAVGMADMGITLLEFVAKTNQRLAGKGFHHRVTPNDISGRFTELGRGVTVETAAGPRFLKLQRLMRADGSRECRDGAGVWVVAC